MTRIISIVGGMQPSAPTIGTATAGDTTASVAFTPSTYIGKGTITYTATSSPGGLTATSASSPITVTGLTNGTAYTFTVVGNTNYGVASVASAASNSITPAVGTSYESIATYVVSTPVPSITFSTIPQTFTHLQLRMVSRSTRSAGFSNVIRGQYNGDTTTGNYWAYHFFGGDGASPVAANGAAFGSAGGAFGHSVGANQTAETFCFNILDIEDYKNTNKLKVGRVMLGYSDNAGIYPEAQFWSHLWKSTTAINQITLIDNTGDNFAQHSHFALYGIRGA